MTLTTITKPRTDEMLAEEFRRRHDRAALGELIGRYDDRIYAFLLRLLRDPHQARDASQEAFLRMLRSLESYRADLPFRPWLYRIALNAARTLRSREAEQVRRERAVALARPEVDPAANPAEEAIRKEVASFVDELPEPQKEALLLHYFQGLSHSELASLLEIPAGTVATRIHGGLESLRGRLAVLGMAVAAGVIEELLAQGSAEAAPSSVRAAVFSELARGALAGPVSAALSKGIFMANAKFTSTVALMFLCLAGGGVVGYAVRSSQEPSQPETASAPARKASAAARPAAEPAVPSALPGSSPSSASKPTPSTPAGPAERKKTKLEKAAALVARMLQASGKGPKGRLQITAADSADFMAIMSDPEITAMMEDAGNLKWEHSGEFMVALVAELIPDLAEGQKSRLREAIDNIVARAKTLSEQSGTSVERKLLELRQGREFFDQLGVILTPEQRSGLDVLERMGVHSVPARLLWSGSPEGGIPEVLDLWSKTLSPLGEEDRRRLAGTAGEYLARLRAIQADLEARYGTPFLKSLSNPPTIQLSAALGPQAAPARSAPEDSSSAASPDSGLTAKQLDAYGRLLELERDQRQVLAALLPGQAEAIRNAEPYIPLLSSGPSPGFLGVAVNEAPGGGVRVTQVVEDSTAKGAGLQVGDVILELNGSPISDHQALFTGIRDAGQGAEVKLKVRREGAEFYQAVRLGAPTK